MNATIKITLCVTSLSEEFRWYC